MQVSPTPNVSASASDTLLLALFVATVVHIGVLFGINFQTPKAPKIDQSIEVTLSHTPLKKSPKQARLLADEHQLGAGNDTQKPQPLAQSVPSPRSEVLRVPKSEQHNRPVSEVKKPAPQKVITQANSPVKAVKPAELSEDPVEQTVQDAPKLNVETLQQQIAQLGEQIRHAKLSSEESKIKYVNSISTHKYLAAQYVKDWEDKVERTGNLNYPEAARNNGKSQTLTMDVGIQADGSIYSMRVVRSSGSPALDEAAKRIVKMSAPFAAIPTELLKEVNVLVITRVWKFSDETGMTAR